jgi:hypothetical protein
MSSRPWIAKSGALPPVHHSSRCTRPLVAKCAIWTCGQHSTDARMFGSEAGDNHRAPSATHSGPISLVGGASRNIEPNGIGEPIKPPAAIRMTLRTIAGRSAAKQRAIRLPKA